MTLRRDRRRGQKKRPVSHIKPVWSVCPNCGQPGAHFVPPCFGDPGFFVCEKPQTKPTGFVIHHMSDDNPPTAFERQEPRP